MFVSGVTKTAWHLQQRRKICSFIEGSRKRESPDSGRESVDQLLQSLRTAEKRRVGRAERGLDSLRWLVQRGRASSLEEQISFVVVAEGEEI